MIFKFAQISLHVDMRIIGYFSRLLADSDLMFDGF